MEASNPYIFLLGNRSVEEPLIFLSLFVKVTQFGEVGRITMSLAPYVGLLVL
jgi:hypothetical protein